MKFIAALLLSSFVVTASAEVYHWIDNEGHTHYGDRAAIQSTQKAEPVTLQNTAVTIDPEAEKSRQQLRELENFRQEQQQSQAQKTAQLQQQNQQSQQRCKTVQDSIRVERDSAVLFRYDDAGNRVFWTEEARVAYREKLQALHQKYCGAEAN